MFRLSLNYKTFCLLHHHDHQGHHLYLPLPPGHALHGAVLEEGRQAAAEAVGDQVRHQAAGLAHLSLSFFRSIFGFLEF